tara:strand:- start:539 stop:1432 length:894 start_codon:yes stop_codon:yes gene_type:complete
MKIIKLFLFRFLRNIYLLPSIFLILFDKKNYQYPSEKNQCFLIDNRSDLNDILNEIENFYLKDCKEKLNKIIQDNKNNNKYSSEIEGLLDKSLQEKLVNILKNQDFISYLSCFFGYKLKFNSYLIRLNFYNSNLSEEEGPKMWHRDNDSFFGQIKLFSVFNNLDLQSGGNFYFVPQKNIKDYEFVNNSVKNTKLNLLDQRSRILNSEMNKVKDVEKNIVKFGNVKNQFLAIDTNDTYHKGGFIKQDGSVRLLLQVIYEPYFNSLSNYHSSYKNNSGIFHIKNILTGIKNRLRSRVRI